MILLLVLLSLTGVVHGNNYTFINACVGNIPLIRLKEEMANAFHQHIYSPHLNDLIDVYNGTVPVLDPVSSLQTDIIIEGFNKTTMNETNCHWKDIFSMYFMPSAMRGNKGVHYLFFFYDSRWCGDEPYHAVAMLKMKHVVVPIAIGPHTDRMELYHIAGPCPKPSCMIWKDYLILE